MTKGKGLILLLCFVLSSPAIANKKLEKLTLEQLCANKVEAIWDLVESPKKKRRAAVAAMDKELVDRGLDKRYCEGGEYGNTGQLGGLTDQVLMEGRGVYEGYVGSSKDGKPHGKGFVKFSDGTTYSGQWKDGLMHGKGVLTRLDGYKAVGLFEFNKLQGNTLITFPNGDTMECYFVNKNCTGVVAIRLKNGELYRAVLVDGQIKKGSMKLINN